MNTREAECKSRRAHIKSKIAVSCVQSPDGRIEYEKMIAYAQIEWGVARRTAKDYIDPHILYGTFINKDGFLSISEDLEHPKPKKEVIEKLKY